MHYLKNKIKKKVIRKKNKNVEPFQNGGQVADFYFASFWFWSKFEKNTFQKKKINEICLKVGAHE